MALQVLPPATPVNGYDTLANVIANAGDRYAQQARQDQLLAQQRQQQLADVASNRDYATQQWLREREARLSDEQRMAAQQLRQKMLADAVEAGLIQPGDEDDPTKVTAALHELARRGALDKYKSEIQAGFLKVGDVTNPDAVNNALQAEANFNTQQRQSSLADVANARAAATAAGKRYADTQQRIQTLETEAANVRVTQPTNEEIRNRAYNLAQILLPPGGKPSDKQVADSTPDAIKALMTERLDEANNRKNSLSQRAAALRTQVQADQNLIESYARQGISPDSNAWLAPDTNPLVSPPSIGLTPEQAKSALAAAKAATSPASPISGSLSSDRWTANPTNDPTIAAGVAQLAANKSNSLKQQIQEAMAERDKVVSDLQAVRQGVDAGSGYGNQLAGIPGSPQTARPTLDPIQMAQQTYALIQKGRQLDQTIQTLHDELAKQDSGSTTVTSTPPNSAIQSTLATPAQESAPGRPVVSAPPLFPTPNGNSATSPFSPTPQDWWSPGP